MCAMNICGCPYCALALDMTPQIATESRTPAHCQNHVGLGAMTLG